jgi:rod shape determining protein RodA
MRTKHLILILLMISATGFLGFKYIMRDYQRNRLISFVNPNLDPTGLNYNQRQSMIAVGSGRF